MFRLDTWWGRYCPGLPDNNDPRDRFLHSPAVCHRNTCCWGTQNCWFRLDTGGQFQTHTSGRAHSNLSKVPNYIHCTNWKAEIIFIDLSMAVCQPYLRGHWGALHHSTDRGSRAYTDSPGRSQPRHCKFRGDKPSSPGLSLPGSSSPWDRSHSDLAVHSSSQRGTDNTGWHVCDSPVNVMIYHNLVISQFVCYL